MQRKVTLPKSYLHIREMHLRKAKNNRITGVKVHMA